MKKRAIAVILAAALGVSSGLAGCQNADSAAVNQKDTVIETEAVGLDEADASEVAAGAESGDDAATALSLMQEVNPTTANVMDDNYRTWYEVFVYSFFDSDGDGIGDLKGLTEKLDYINDGDDSTDTDLGCNGIWLMPIMPSTTYHKYDVINYEDIDPEYGTMDDFKELLEECHARDIHVIIDLVMNHTSSQHEWFQAATKYLKELPVGEEPDVSVCPYVDYYNFSKEKQTGYTQVEGTEWYYESQFWSEMPDLNLGNQAVRDEFAKITQYWLDLGVDGFRLDAAKEYYTGSDEKNVEVLTWFCDAVKQQKEDAYIVAEVWNDMTTYAKYYESGIDSCFNFAFANSEGIIANTIKRTGEDNAASYGKQLVYLQETLEAKNASYVDAPFYTNHDMARGAGYYSGDYSENQTKIAQAMNLLMSGSAFLYYGEELGMKGSGKDENKRAPMYWSLDEEAEGMCDGPKDMDSVKMKYGSLEEQAVDGNSIYTYVKEIIKLRNAYPEIARGKVEVDENCSNENICCIRKVYEGEEAVLVFNISEENQTVELSEEGLSLAGTLLTGTESVELDGAQLKMPAYSVAILK